MPYKDPEKARAYHREYARKHRASDPQVGIRASESTQRWRAKNPEKVRAGDRSWRERNPEKVRAKEQRRKSDPLQHEKQLVRVRAHQKKYREDHPDAVLNTKLRAAYGITGQQRLALEMNQQGCCAICRKSAEMEGKRLSIDHCHESSLVRGLLCTNCNNGLGRFKHDVALLQRAVAYLLRPPAFGVL